MHFSRWHILTFGILCIGLCYLLNLHEYISIRPQSIHQWRQTVCLNITLNYAEQDNTFLQTETNLLNADYETTGIAMGEFPLFYYVMGKVWKLTGQSEVLYRISTLVLFLCALFMLSKGLFSETGNYLASAFVSLLFLVLPVTAYYAVNFLMDGVALSTLILAWYCFYRAFNGGEKKWYGLFFVLFTLTGLFKITLLVSVIALLMVALGTWFFPTFIQIQKRDWVKPTIALLLLAIAVNVTWYTFAINYNNLHGGWITENGIYPIWELTQEKWQQVFDWVASYWYKQYAPPFFYVFFALTLLVFVRGRLAFKAYQFIYWVVALTTLGTLAYVLLWIQVFDNHDYYVFALYPLFFAIVIVSFLSAWHRLTQIGKRVFVAFLGVLLFLGATYSGNELAFRLTGWPNGNGQNEFQSYFDIEPYLRNEIGISRTEKVVAYPDYSVCISLYLADQKGWQMNPQQDTSYLRSRIERGARYILVNDSSFYTMQGVEAFELKPIGRHKKIDVLKVPDQTISAFN